MNYSTDHRQLQQVFNFPTEKFKSCSIENLEDYKKIVSGPAYRDFTPRTIAGLKKENIQCVLDWLAKELYNYIHNREVLSFDNWHKNTCEEFCKKFKESYKTIPDGKAQKIVNISLKYLYCLEDSQKYESKFSDCHMVIDKFTLEWFIRNVVPKAESVRVSKIREISWSNLNYGEDEKDVYSYLWIQKSIKDYLNSEKNTVYKDINGGKLSSFLAEFYIWQEMQLHLAMETLYSQVNKNQDKFKEGTIIDKITTLTEMLNKLKKDYV